MKLIFAGTPDFATPSLSRLQQENEVVAVFTQPDRRSGRGRKQQPPPVKVLAQELGLNVMQPTHLKNQSERIKEFDADVIVVIAYGMLLPQSILDIPPLGCINAHASLLPRWRGAAPIQRAIAAGDTHTGVSIMKMEAGLDTGPVFASFETPITDTDTSASLHDRLAHMSAEALSKTLKKLQQDPGIVPTPQATKGVTYAHKITKQEAKIDWRQSAQSIDAAIRAFNPWPICDTWHKQELLRLWRAQVVKSNESYQPHVCGEVVEISADGILILCGEDSLLISEIQKKGGRVLPAAQFLNGYQIQVGDVLNNYQTPQP